MTNDQKDIDELSGIDTTGHEWDGIKELNNPLPRWWVYTFYVTVAWAVLYWIAMPAIPLVSGYTQGMLGYSQRQVVADQIAEAKAARSVFDERLMSMPLEEARNDQEMLNYALAAAEASFGDNCATCHGSGAQGFPGYPNLNDDDWIWGGSLEEIQQTIRYGIRSEEDETRYTIMPAFLAEGLLPASDIRDLVEYVRSLSGEEHNEEQAARAAQVYEDNCASCHMSDGSGDKFLGAPNLSDKIWLIGKDRDTLYQSIGNMKPSVMPAWHKRLDEATIRSLTLYVHSLGGGE